MKPHLPSSPLSSGGSSLHSPHSWVTRLSSTARSLLRLRRWLATSVALVTATACSSAPAPSSPTLEVEAPPVDRPSTIVWQRSGDIDTLDPHRTASVFSWQVFAQVYDTLLAFDQDGQVQPHLAKNWFVSEDGLSVTLQLQDNLLCHDGSSFDADDVVFTVNRALDPAMPSATYANWGPITEVSAVDPLTVAFQFAEPFSAFVPFLADPFSSMICESSANLGPDFGPRAAIGTGPWQVVDWQHGDELTLERNPTYVNWGQPVDNDGPPHVERLVVKTVSNAYGRLSALKQSDAHLVSDPPIAELNAIQQNAQLSLTLAQKTGQNVFFQFTVGRAPFDDIRARQAVAHAIDPEAAIFQTWGNLVQREHCPVARGVLGNDPEFCQQFSYDHDPDKAKALLQDMGYGPDNPMEVRLLTWLGDQREDIVRVFQQQLQAVGIEAELDIMDISTLNARVRLENQRKIGVGTLDLMGWAWYDPDILYALWHSPGAYGGYTHPELDALLEKTRTTTDPEARLEAIQAVQAHLLQQAVVVPVYTPGWLWIYASNHTMQGFKLAPFSRPLFNDVVLDETEQTVVQNGV